MKKVLHLFVSMLITTILLACFSMIVSAAEVSDFEYRVYKIDYGSYKSDYTCLVISNYIGDDTELVFSDELFPMSEYKYDKIRIEQNAIVNKDNLETIIFPENTERIITGGIVGCNSLRNVVFLGADTIIDDINDVWDDENFTVYGLKDSTAEDFAKNNKVSFVELKTTSCELKATALSTGARLKWNDCGADSYTLYAVSADGTVSEIYNGTALTYTYKPVETGVYEFYVEANIGNIQIRSDSVYQRAGKVATLTKPTVSKKVSGFSAKLSWKKVSGATEYEIYYAKKGDNKFKLLDTTTSLNYTFTAETKGTYYFKVIAKAESNGIVYAKSAYSKKISVSIKQKTLATPVVSQKIYGKVAVQLSWKKISGATEYEIYFAKKGQTKFTLLTTTTETDYTYIAPTKSTYYFKVVAKGYNSKGALTGKSAKSKQITAKLTGKEFVVDHNGHWEGNEYVESSYLAGTDIPEGFYIIERDKDDPMDPLSYSSIAATADFAEIVGHRDSEFQNFITTRSGPMLIYVENGKYLLLSSCSAKLMRSDKDLPDSIMWAGKNCEAGKYTFKYDKNFVLTATYKFDVNSLDDRYTVIDEYTLAMEACVWVYDIASNTYARYVFYSNKDNHKTRCTITLKDGQVMFTYGGAILVS